MADSSGIPDALGIDDGPTFHGEENSTAVDLDLSHLSPVQRRILSRNSSTNANREFGVDISSVLIKMNANNSNLLAAGADMFAGNNPLFGDDDDDGSQPFIYHEGPNAEPANMSPEALRNALVSFMFSQYSFLHVLPFLVPFEAWRSLFLRHLIYFLS